ncbi:MAG TPA: ABC transporter substrate-binding protein [Baekduia sp.]|uniref:ABC transporter substrate-binding protein n=1 Tax=Baekduia sp. TaxID=2600305 RepID=UPI002D784C94|nr:ABC transporter substrate-binding protein [Baekduia sp.]HET6509987.1 ABC transporter substrate-binding protein [Baekduia sp.]
MREFVCAVMVGAAMTLAACGSGDDGASSKSGGGKPIKIMVSVPVNSPSWGYPEVIPTIKAGVTSINRAGGINGSPIDVEVCDNGLDVNKAAQCAQKARADKVIALVGTYAQIASSGLYPVLEKSGIPSLEISPSAPVQWSSKSSFPIGGDPFSYVGGVAAGLVGEGCKKIAILGYDDPAYMPYIVMTEKAIKYFGAQAARVRVPLTTKDWTAPVARVFSTGADCLQLHTAGNALPGVVRAVKGSGKHLTIGLNQPNLDSNLSAMGDQLDGIISGAPTITPTMTPAADAPEMMKRYAADLKAAGMTKASDYSISGLSGWLTLQLFAQAAKTLPKGQVTSSALTGALNHTVFSPGVVGTSDFAKPGPLKNADRIKNFTFYVNKVQGGKLVPVREVNLLKAFAGLDPSKL